MYLLSRILVRPQSRGRPTPRYRLAGDGAFLFRSNPQHVGVKISERPPDNPYILRFGRSQARKTAVKDVLSGQNGPLTGGLVVSGPMAGFKGDFPAKNE